MFRLRRVRLQAAVTHSGYRSASSGFRFTVPFRFPLLRMRSCKGGEGLLSSPPARMIVCSLCKTCLAHYCARRIHSIYSAVVLFCVDPGSTLGSGLVVRTFAPQWLTIHVWTVGQVRGQRAYAANAKSSQGIRAACATWGEEDCPRLDWPWAFLL